MVECMSLLLDTVTLKSHSNSEVDSKGSRIVMCRWAVYIHDMMESSSFTRSWISAQWERTLSRISEQSFFETFAHLNTDFLAVVTSRIIIVCHSFSPIPLFTNKFKIILMSYRDPFGFSFCCFLLAPTLQFNMDIFQSVSLSSAGENNYYRRKILSHRIRIVCREFWLCLAQLADPHVNLSKYYSSFCKKPLMVFLNAQYPKIADMGK